MVTRKASSKARKKSGNKKKSTTDGSVTGAAPYQPKMSAAVARSVVKTEIGQRVKLADYRPTVTPLSPKDRDQVIDQAIVMLEQIYAHLPLKRSLHANDPIQ